jgi:hypothetical protein
MITRDEIGKGAYGQGFFDWLKHSSNLWSSQVFLGNLFRRYYNPLDLKARAQKINAFSPDLTLVLHYNSHHVGDKEFFSQLCELEKLQLGIHPRGFLSK